MSMDKIRRYYGVPAKRGARVRYTGEGADKPEFGTITGTNGAHLRIRLDGQKISYLFHPTWQIEYLGASHDADA